MAPMVMGRNPPPPDDMSDNDDDEHYPSRPIKPLPKRSLRERLSPQQAKTIVYPPSAPAVLSLFPHQYSNAPPEEGRTRPPKLTSYGYDEAGGGYPAGNCRDVFVSDEEDGADSTFHGRYTRRSPDVSGHSYRFVQNSHTKHAKPAPPASTTSSADEHDAFENVKNKKKRKIPTAGDAISNGILLQNGLENLGISSPTDEISQYDGSNDRAAPPGIISSAIAKAGTKPPPNQGNVSLLEAEAARKQNISSGQFTFTYEAEASGGVTWPLKSMGPTHSALQSQHRQSDGHGTHAQASTQTNAPPPRRGSNDNGQPPLNKNGNPPAPTRKKKRPTGQEYLIAARQRREQQQLKNLQHPPAPEDQWICEFCEYERIFGTPPMALIRQYEMKDHRHRKQEAEHKRLLEKAKMKGRKSKKTARPAAGKNAAVVDDHHTASRHGSVAHTHSSTPREASEAYYDDGEHDDDDDDGGDDPPYLEAVPTPPGAYPEDPMDFPDRRVRGQGGAGNSEALKS